MAFGRRRPSSTPGTVWIVVDESADAPEPVLGVFASEDEARTFVDAQVPRHFAELAYTSYAVGWTYDGGNSRRYTS